MDTFPKMYTLVPEGEIGIAKVSHFEVSEDEAKFTRLRATIHRNWGEYVPAGRYAKLVVDRELAMSDTQMERDSNYEVVRRANGKVLVAGLGLGMILHPILKKESVTHIVVVEKYPDVIALIAPTLHSPKLSIVNADIFGYITKDKFDTIYFDIWSDVCSDNYPGMKQLHRKFARNLNRSNPVAWMSSWKRDEMRGN